MPIYKYGNWLLIIVNCINYYKVWEEHLNIVRLQS